MKNFTLLFVILFVMTTSALAQFYIRDMADSLSEPVTISVSSVLMPPNEHLDSLVLSALYVDERIGQVPGYEFMQGTCYVRYELLQGKLSHGEVLRVFDDTLYSILLDQHRIVAQILTQYLQFDSTRNYSITVPLYYSCDGGPDSVYVLKREEAVYAIQKGKYKVIYHYDKLKEEPIPVDPEACFTYLDLLTDSVSRSVIASWTTDDFVAKSHFDLGMWIRNQMKLWDASSELSTWFTERGVHHPDEMSAILLSLYHRYLKGEKLDIESYIRQYHKH